jgi:DNA primase
VANQQLHRIPQEFIDTLLDRTDIVDVVDSRVKLKRSGRNYSACCPFHKEKTPSFSVAPDKQFYYCFGCGAGGNAIGFLMELDHLSFPEAVEELARKAGMDVPKQEQNLSPAAIAAQQAKTQARNQAYDLLEQANLYYQKQLRQHPQKSQAVNYLKERGLSGQIAQRFGIGFAPSGWQNLLDAISTSKQTQQALIDNGMAVKKEDSQRVYDFFRERIMFPIRNSKGKVIAFGGRVLGDAKPKYLNSPETDVFHKEQELYGLYEARQHERNLKRILVVEGYMDVVALAQHNINYAVATLGTSTSRYHLERIFKMVSEVIFCFDGDAAGIKAAVRAMHTCVEFMSDGRQARFLLLPQGEDPDTLVRSEGAEALTTRIANATPFSEFLFQHFAEDLDVHNLEHRAKLATDIMPVIQSMPKGLMKTMMLSKLEDVTGLNQDTLTQLTAVTETPAPQSHSNQDTAEQDLHHYDAPIMADEPAGDYDAMGYDDYPMPDMDSHSYDYQESFGEANLSTTQTADSKPKWQNYKYQNRQQAEPRRAIKVLNPAQAAIRLILRHPHLAEAHTELPTHLQALHMPEAKILVELLSTCQAMNKHLKRAPKAAELQSECAQMEAWPLMQDLAALESLQVAGDHASQLQEAIDKLQHHYFDQRFEELSRTISQSKDNEELALAKQQLKALLSEK